MPHDHASHSGHHGGLHGAAHHHGRLDNRRRVFWAMMLTGSFVVAEIIGGILSGSLALLSDAGHMLTDTASLGLAWLAFQMAARPADARRTYGYHRLEVLAAFTNGLSLIAIVVWIVIEAVRRLFAPVEMTGGLMLTIAALGLLVNLISLTILNGGNRDNLNIRGAAAHVLGDLLGSLAAVVAALVVLGTGWTPIDPILSLLIAAILLRSGWQIVRRAGHVLLEGAPEGMDVAAIGPALVAAIPEVVEVHHVHVWDLTPERGMATLHARLNDGADADAALRRIQETLADRFGLRHATIQIEGGACADEAAPPHPVGRSRTQA